MSNNSGFALAEDAALKRRLQTVYVSDDLNYQRYVDVYFRYPEAETEVEYPFMTIELLNISHARNRQLSEQFFYYSSNPAIPQEQNRKNARYIDYFPSEYDEAGLADLAGYDGYIAVEPLVPVDLTYQVSTYARSQRHDRQMTSALLRYVFPIRRGFIEIPEDGTLRRCDLLDFQQADILDQETGYKKRIFRKIFTVNINAEIPQNDIVGVPLVQSVNGELKETRDDLNVLSITQTQEF